MDADDDLAERDIEGIYDSLKHVQSYEGSGENLNLSLNVEEVHEKGSEISHSHTQERGY